MYQVLIVDDEPIVKIALRSMLDWGRLVSTSAERPPMDRRPWKWLSACIRISSSVI